MRATPKPKATYNSFVKHVLTVGLFDPMMEICRLHAVTLQDIYAKHSRGSAHLARCEVWEMLRDRYHKSSSEIAALFNRDHAGVYRTLERFSLLKLEKATCPECGGDGADAEDSTKSCWKCGGLGS